MKKVITIIIGVLLFTAINAQFIPPQPSYPVYYIDSINGNNSNSGKSPIHPWKNISKLNSSMSSIVAGVTVAFKRGQVHHGGILQTNSGTSKKHITYTAYGVGTNPIISGMQPITGWSNYNGNVWRAYCTLGTTVTVLTVNGVMRQIGRYPNATDGNGGYLTIRTHVGNQTIRSRNIDSTKTWTGGSAVTRTQWWYTESCAITAQSNGTLTTATTNSVPYTDNWGFYIVNNINTLDQQWEWYYDATNHYMYIYSTVDPTGFTVEASRQTSCFAATSKSYIDIKNIGFYGSNGININLTSATNVKVQYCTITASGKEGFMIDNGSNITISHNIFTDLSIKGISATAIHDIIIDHNTIRRIGLINGITTNIGTSIQLSSTTASQSTIVQYNTIDSTAYNGVFFSMNGINVSYNVISNFMLNLADGGGIYSTGYGQSPAPSVMNRVISYNNISNGIGTTAGTLLTSVMTEGIYLDSYASYIYVYKNNVSSCTSDGIKESNVTNVITRGNTFYNNGISQLHLEHNTSGYPALSGLEIKSNIMYSKIPSQVCLSIATLTPDITNYALAGKVDSNYYCRPMADTCTISYGITTPNLARVVDFSYFTTRYGWDPHGHRSPFAIAQYTNVSNVGSNLVANGTFNSDVTTSWSITQYTAVLVRTWTTGLDAGTLGLSYTSPTGNLTGHSSLSQSMGTLTSGNIYRLKLSIIGDTTGQAFPIIIRRNIGDYATICSSTLPYYRISSTRNELTAYYTVSSTETGYLDMQTYEGNGGVKLDNITFYNVTATVVDPSTKFLYYTNSTATPVLYTLGGTYYDIYNVAYTTYTVPAYSSIVLIRP